MVRHPLDDTALNVDHRKYVIATRRINGQPSLHNALGKPNCTARTCVSTWELSGLGREVWYGREHGAEWPTIHEILGYSTQMTISMI